MLPGRLTPSDELRRVWDAIPSAGCRGYCVASCGPIAGSPEEIRLLADRGVDIDPDVTNVLLAVLMGAEPDDCPALVNGRCTVYDVRPTVCRLWGAVADMPCPYGCVPEGGRLSHLAGLDVLHRSMKAGASRDHVSRDAEPPTNPSVGPDSSLDAEQR